MTPPLPLEVILHIVSTIDEIESLRSFSLTSSIFLNPCQAILFSHITLSAADSSYPAEKDPGADLLRLLTNASPKIADYIKNITIDEMGPFGAEWLSRDDGRLEKAVDKLKLQNLEWLTIKRLPTPPWATLPESAKSAIIRLCQSPNLADLGLQGAPMQLVKYCGTSLKELDLFECSVGPLTQPANVPLAATLSHLHGPAPRARPRADVVISKLRISNGQHFSRVMAWVLGTDCIKLDGIQLLRIAPRGPGDYDQVTALVRRCSLSLETLNIYSTASYIPNIYERRVIDVNNCPSLTRVEIQMDATGSNRIGQFTGLAWIDAFMNSITPPNTIKSFRLNLLFYLSNLPEKAYGDLGGSLRKIAGHATDEERFPCLERLEVRVFGHADNNHKLYQVADWVSNALATYIPRGSPLLDLKAVEGGSDPPLWVPLAEAE